MSSAIEKRDEEIARLKMRARSIRDRVEEETGELVDVAVEAAAGYLWGSLQREAETNNRPLFTVFGLDPEVVWSLGLIVGGKVVGGEAGRVMRGSGRAIGVIYAYERGQEGSTR